MSEFFNRNSSQVQVTKLNSTTTPNAPSTNTQYNSSQSAPQPSVNAERYDIAQSPNTPSLTPIPTVEVSDSDDEGSDYTYGDEGDSDDYGEDNDSDASSENGEDESDISPLEQQSGGGSRDNDNESTSSVSTTEILSRDPLFLVLSEFFMDEATGNNIVHVGNGLVQVLNKINSKLGRIADALEKKNKRKEDQKK